MTFEYPPPEREGIYFGPRRPEVEVAATAQERARVFHCGHQGEKLVEVLTKDGRLEQEAYLCDGCMRAVNDNPADPRSVEVKE